MTQAVKTHHEPLHGDRLLHELRQGWSPLPTKTLFALAMGGLRVRLMRSVVTMLSVVLAIAFLTYTGLTNYVTSNVVNELVQLERVDPMAGPRIEAAVAGLLALRPIDSLALPAQRELAARLKLDDDSAAKAQLVAMPEMVRNAELSLEDLRQKLEVARDDPGSLPVDIKSAEDRYNEGESHLERVRSRVEELRDEADMANWIRDGRGDSPERAARLKSVLNERYQALIGGVRSPSRLSDEQLEQIEALLPLARAAGREADADTAAEALAQDRIKRQASELRTLVRRAGINIQATMAGNPMDTWLIVMAMLTCAVGIANAMLMSVTERFREIGTMKCLGAQDNLVVKLFLLESAFLGVIGAAIGIVLGVLVALLAAVLMFRGFGLEYFPIRDGMVVILLSILGGVALSVAGAVYPAFAASRMRPVDALRVDE